MVKKTVILLGALLFVMVNAHSANDSIFTADNIIQLIKDKISKVQSFRGSFTYTMNNKTQSGTILYKSPSKFSLNYSTGQRIISNGKELWLIFYSQNIAINEPLEKIKDTPLLGWNIDRLLYEYAPTFPKEGHKDKLNNKNVYKLYFIPKSTTAGFKSMMMYISEEGDILRVDAINQLNLTISFTIRYDAFNEAVADWNFKYEANEGTQIYENILIPRDKD